MKAFIGFVQVFFTAGFIALQRSRYTLALAFDVVLSVGWVELFALFVRYLSRGRFWFADCNFSRDLCGGLTEPEQGKYFLKHRNCPP